MASTHAKLAKAPQVRIIGGQWKRTQAAPCRTSPACAPRPTGVRETLFNWLASRPPRRGWPAACSMPLPAPARSAWKRRRAARPRCCWCEQDAELVAQLRAAQAKLDAAAVRVRARQWLIGAGRAAAGSVDLMFLDPPFDAGLFEQGPGRGAARPWRPEGVIYLEAPAPGTTTKLAPYGLVLARHLKAGAVHAHLLRPAA